MKKIIKNKVYDTDTALLIKQADHPNITSGEGSCKQSLYRKRTGEDYAKVLREMEAEFMAYCEEHIWD